MTGHDRAPVREGDRLLIDSPVTAVAGLTWTTVEAVERHAVPGELPWNSGPGFPFRVGYRIDGTEPGAATARGVVWLAPDGADAVGAVRAVVRVSPGSSTSRPAWEWSSASQLLFKADPN